MRECVVVASTREADLASNASGTSNRMARATAELSQPHDASSTQSMELANVANESASIKLLKDNVEF